MDTTREPTLTELMQAFHAAARRDAALADVSREEGRQRDLGVYTADPATCDAMRATLGQTEEDDIPLALPEADPEDTGAVPICLGGGR